MPVGLGLEIIHKRNVRQNIWEPISALIMIWYYVINWRVLLVEICVLRAHKYPRKKEYTFQLNMLCKVLGKWRGEFSNWKSNPLCHISFTREINELSVSKQEKSWSLYVIFSFMEVPKTKISTIFLLGACW